MRKTGMRSFSILLAILLAFSPAIPAKAGSGSALQAFELLLAGEEEPRTDQSRELLDEAMDGSFSREALSSGEAPDLAEWLDQLKGISSSEIAAYAASRNLYAAQVRNACYRSLAAVLAEYMQKSTAGAGGYGSELQILSLFLTTDVSLLSEEELQEKEDIRSQMTPALARKMSLACGLPFEFISFVIMDGQWDDESWKNDEDWKKAAGWGSLGGAHFQEISMAAGDPDSHDTVEQLQQLLIRLGYLKGTADGVFGPRTQAALVEAQLANSLVPDGRYSEEDWLDLSSETAVYRYDYESAFWDPDTDDFWDNWDDDDWDDSLDDDDREDDDRDGDDWYDDDRDDDDRDDDDWYDDLDDDDWDDDDRDDGDRDDDDRDDDD